LGKGKSTGNTWGSEDLERWNDPKTKTKKSARKKERIDEERDQVCVQGKGLPEERVGKVGKGWDRGPIKWLTQVCSLRQEESHRWGLGCESASSRRLNSSFQEGSIHLRSTGRVACLALVGYKGEDWGGMELPFPTRLHKFDGKIVPRTAQLSLSCGGKMKRMFEAGIIKKKFL